MPPALTLFAVPRFPCTDDYVEWLGVGYALCLMSRLP